MAKEIFKSLNILLCILFLYSVHSEDDVCVEKTACLCRLSEDRIIDLSHVVTDNKPLSINNGNLTYYFYPCKNYPYNKTNVQSLNLNVNETLNNCTKGASVCLYNETDRSLIDLGEIKDVTFTGKFPKSLVYTKQKITTMIKLDCTPFDKTSYLELDGKQSGNDGNNHHLVLFSNHACVQIEQYNGLSTGTTLLILLCTGFGIYLLGGAAVLHFLRGAQGKEMVPNFDFWVDLPYLVKDGTIFLLSGCNPLSITTVETYDRI